jgi:hypothetical protein
MRTKPTTHFTVEEVEYSYPDGLIMPIAYGLKALMEKGADGHVRWKTDPELFLDDHLEAIVRKYRVILEAFRYDPQKVAKNEGSYELTRSSMAAMVPLALILLRHELPRRCLFDAWQQVHRDSRFAMPTAIRRRKVAIEVGTWRSGRSGRTPLAPALG